MRMGQDGEATMLVANQLQNLYIESHNTANEKQAIVTVAA